jgi:hypothetical protein
VTVKMPRIAPETSGRSNSPERLGLRLTDRPADHLTPPRVVHAVGDHQRLVPHPTWLTDRSTFASNHRRR